MSFTNFFDSDFICHFRGLPGVWHDSQLAFICIVKKLPDQIFELGLQIREIGVSLSGTDESCWLEVVSDWDKVSIKRFNAFSLANRNLKLCASDQRNLHVGVTGVWRALEVSKVAKI